MSRTAKAHGARKTHENRIASDPVSLANKTVRTTKEPDGQIPAIDLNKNTWSVRMAAAWAGVPERTLYRMLRAGAVPCIAMGESQIPKLSAAKSGKRVRKCYRFVIPRVAFMKAWENLGSAENLGNTTA